MGRGLGERAGTSEVIREILELLHDFVHPNTLFVGPVAPRPDRPGSGRQAKVRSSPARSLPPLPPEWASVVQIRDGYTWRCALTEAGPAALLPFIGEVPFTVTP
jgi:hypothetical protein